jgi:AcrR family transcriptional regulator
LEGGTGMAPNPELESIRRNQILEAALKTIAQQGCANVTMDDICQEAGLSKGGLAHYFKSKNELFKAAFQKFFEGIFQRGEETMAQYNDPLDKLLSFGWLYDAQDPDVPTGYPILFDFMAIAVHDHEYREIFNDWINNWLLLLKKAILEGQGQGLFNNVDPEEATRSISAIYQGVATRWYMAPQSHSTQWALNTIKKAITGLLDSYDE